jgi:hypothetical protein
MLVQPLPIPTRSQPLRFHPAVQSKPPHPHHCWCSRFQHGHSRCAPPFCLNRRLIHITAAVFNACRPQAAAACAGAVPAGPDCPQHGVQRHHGSHLQEVRAGQPHTHRCARAPHHSSCCDLSTLGLHSFFGVLVVLGPVGDMVLGSVGERGREVECAVFSLWLTYAQVTHSVHC